MDDGRKGVADEAAAGIVMEDDMAAAGLVRWERLDKEGNGSGDARRGGRCPGVL